MQNLSIFDSKATHFFKCNFSYFFFLEFYSKFFIKICAIYNCETNCGHKMKKCASGNQEIFEHRFCDGIIDCADESDEQGCSCKYNFRNLPLRINLPPDILM